MKAFFSRARKTEIDFAADAISNLAIRRKTVLPEDFNERCKEFDEKQKKLVQDKLRKMGFRVIGEVVQLTDTVQAEKKIKDSELLNYLIKPEYINTEPDVIQVGNQFFKGLIATGYPAVVNDNWLGELTKEKSNLDFSIFIEPSSIRGIEIYLNNQLKKVENDLFKYNQRGVTNPALEARKKDLLIQLSNLLSGNYKLYKMSLYLAAKGNNADEARNLATGVLSSLHSNGIEAKYTINYNEQLIKSIIPTGNNHLPGKEILIPGPAAAASFPFSSSFYDIDEEEGILLGFNSNNIPIAKSIWKLPKYIGAIIGSTGSGKSYAAKALILNERMANDTKVFILDPEDEYTEMCKRIPRSQVIRISKDSRNIPNLLSLNGVDLLEKLMVLPRIFNVLLGGLSESQKPLLERCLVKTYLSKGIKEDDEKTHGRKAPKLSDLYKVMEKEKNNCKDYSLKNDYEIMLNRLSRYCTGIFKFMNTDNTGILRETRFVVFEFKSMPLEIRAVLMMTLLEFINGRFRSTDDRKMLVLDEAWRVLKSREEAEYIENFARTFRKNNGSLILITQSVAELENSSEGKAFLSNSSFKYLFKTEGAVLDETARVFGLNDTEKQLISIAGTGEGILIWDQIHHKIQVRVDPQTHSLITTHPEERKLLKAGSGGRIAGIADKKMKRERQ